MMGALPSGETYTDRGFPHNMHPADLFRENLSVIDQVIATVCRKARIQGADAEDFASTVHLALMEDDYAVLRKYGQRASLGAYLGVVVQRLLLDQVAQAAGQWHPSAAAKRLGRTAVLLEELLHRRGRSVDEALPLVRNLEPSLTREDLARLAERFPSRAQRPRAVPLDLIEDAAPAPETADARVAEEESRRLCAHAGRILRATMGGWTAEDRVILRLRFVSSMSVADIAQMLRVPQRPLYRRLERLLEELRTALVRNGIGPGHATELIGSAAEMPFGLAEEEPPAAAAEGTR
jgi:RNA polymerase sigma factor (sigma-70 family)